MARTTLDIDAPILKDLKRLGRREGKSLGRLASELLAEALSRRGGSSPPPRFRWAVTAMGPPRIDLEDREGLQLLLDREDLEAAKP